MEKEVVIEEKEVPKKKKHKFLKKLIIFIIIVGIIVVSLGFLLPGLLWPKSLGVTYTKKDYDSIISKLNYIKDSAPNGESSEDYQYIYGNLTNVDVEFTSEEITAFMNYNRPSYYAVKNVQVRINKDGSVEASGSINVNYVLNEILGGKYSKETIKKEIPALGMLPSSVNVYIKASGAITNNSSNINIDSVSVQGIPIPSNYIASNEAKVTVNDGVNKLMNTYSTKSKASFKSISVNDGKLHFDGSVPSSLERIKK